MGAKGEAELASPVTRVAPVIWSGAPGVALPNLGAKDVHAQVLSSLRMN